MSFSQEHLYNDATALLLASIAFGIGTLIHRSQERQQQQIMTAHALLFTLAAIGISETAYLIRKRIARERPICVIGQECHQVLESKHNNILRVPNEVSGLVFYAAVSLITAFLVIGIEPAGFWDISAKILIGIGTLMSLIFIYLQWQIIKAWCFWCLMSAVTVFLMALIVITSDLTLLS